MESLSVRTIFRYWAQRPFYNWNIYSEPLFFFYYYYYGFKWLFSRNCLNTYYTNNNASLNCTGIYWYSWVLCRKIYLKWTGLQMYSFVEAKHVFCECPPTKISNLRIWNLAISPCNPKTMIKVKWFKKIQLKKSWQVQVHVL